MLSTSASALRQIVDAGDNIVVTGNHENQTIAAEHGASCLIVSCDAPIAQDVIDLAKKRDCAIISTPRDTFEVACLLIMSMPVREKIFPLSHCEVQRQHRN